MDDKPTRRNKTAFSISPASLVVLACYNSNESCKAVLKVLFRH